MTVSLLLAALLSGPASADTGAGDCDDWGAISPDERAMAVGEFATFRISGGSRCGDAATCSWWTDGGKGDFLQTSGSPVTWRAPTELEDCVTENFRMWASCTDGSTTSYADITVRCSHEQLVEVQASRNAQVSGGGCNGPVPSDGSSSGASDTGAAAVFLLLPLVGLRRLRRR
ncbi:MAG: hypothetical protein H6742_01305 [Alphaproteobacteria bacterium]|nr:hypothetical protein [Alphaproteobacteria bacterium]